MFAQRWRNFFVNVTNESFVSCHWPAVCCLPALKSCRQHHKLRWLIKSLMLCWLLEAVYVIMEDLKFRGDEVCVCVCAHACVVFERCARLQEYWFSWGVSQAQSDRKYMFACVCVHIQLHILWLQPMVILSIDLIWLVCKRLIATVWTVITAKAANSINYMEQMFRIRTGWMKFSLSGVD